MPFFSDYGISERIALVKKEFLTIVKSIFESPERLKAYIDSGKLSNEQCKSLLTAINSLNAATCACCRKLDNNKIKMNPVAPDLDPLLDVALETASQKRY